MCLGHCKSCKGDVTKEQTATSSTGSVKSICKGWPHSFRSKRAQRLSSLQLKVVNFLNKLVINNRVNI